jgi:protoheme ferro-lyase
MEFTFYIRIYYIIGQIWKTIGMFAMSFAKADLIQRLRFGKQYGYEVLFKKQDTRPSGKVGIILAEMGMPEDYELPFYNHFMAYVFDYVLPPIIKPIILADRGIGLIDPDNPMARASFQPKQLIDAFGSFTNQAGRPYVECKVKWIPPNLKNPWDHGYFLYNGEGPNGIPDVCDKSCAKIVGWYFGKLIPEKRVAWRSQLDKVYQEAVKELSSRYERIEFHKAYYMDPETLRHAAQELLDAGCRTIIYQNFNCPLYSDFEDYGYSQINLHRFIARRAKVIMADQLGMQPAMREAYIEMLRDQLKELLPEASVLVILSCHGHPFKKETIDARALHFRKPLEESIRKIMAKWQGNWDLVWSFDEYADEFWDHKHSKFSTYEAYCKAIREGFDYAIELPTEFLAENTDLMIFHAMKKFNAFAEYDRNQAVPYPDWEKPLVRTFHEGKTTGIYASCPVGPYRKYVVSSVVDSIASLLNNHM